MRIAFDVRSLLEDAPSGVSVYTRTLFETLSMSSDLDVTPVVTGRSPVRLSESAEKKLRRIAMPNPLLNASVFVCKRPVFLSEHAADTYVLPNWNFLSLPKNMPLTLVVHDLSFVRNPRWYSPKQRLWHKAVKPRVLVQRADRIIAVSEWTKQDLISLFHVPGDRISVLYPAPSVFPVIETSTLSLPEKFIFFLGTLEERKNPVSIVEAFDRIAAKHTDLHLYLAGKSGYGAEKVFRAIQRSKFCDRIHCLGYVSAADRAFMYAHAAAFVYPSLYEGFGIPVLDALRAGLPIVTANRTAMIEVVRDAAVVVEPYDISQIALSLDEILSNEQFSQMLRSRALKRAKVFSGDMREGVERIFLGQ